MKSSAFLSLNISDLLKGFIVAFTSAIITGLYTYASSVPPTVPSAEQLKTIAMVGFASALAYILKNLFTNSKDQFMTKEKK
jgi:uncharacterized membrane protein